MVYGSFVSVITVPIHSILNLLLLRFNSSIDYKLNLGTCLHGFQTCLDSNEYRRRKFAMKYNCPFASYFAIKLWTICVEFRSSVVLITTGNHR